MQSTLLRTYLHWRHAYFFLLLLLLLQKQKQQVIQAERLILKELGFNVHTKHSHKLVVTYCTLIGVDSINKECVNLAWNYMNDGHRTDVFVRYKRKKERKKSGVPLTFKCNSLEEPDEVSLHCSSSDPPMYHQQCYLVGGSVSKLPQHATSTVCSC